jgi:hypothetical protein
MEEHLMRHFIVAKQSEKISRTYGGSNIVYNVYELKRSVPVFRCSFEVCTRAWKGGEGVHNAMNALAWKLVEPENKTVIPKRFRDGYYDPNNKHFRITSV